MSGLQLHETRELFEQCDARSCRALQHANMRTSALTSRGAQRVAHRKCLTFTRECVSMHVMEHSNAAVARGEKVSPSDFGTRNRNKRTAFTGHDMQTVEAIEIAASEGMKLTAYAGFTSAVS